MLPQMIKFVAGTLIFAGLPIVAWGVSDVAGFFAHPARSGYVLAVLVIQAVALARDSGLGSRGGTSGETQPRERLILLMLQVIPLAILIFAPYCDRRGIAVMGDAVWLRYAGLTIFAGGFLLMFLAEAALGEQFSVEVTLQEGHRLVTDGLYAAVRHPRYLGIISYNMGISLLFRSWIALLFTIVLAIVLVLRIRDEEAMLAREFGTEWAAYAKRIKCLIPFVY